MTMASRDKYDVMIDVHTHLTDAVFKQDIENVVTKAQQTGVRAAVCMTETQADISPVLELHKRFPNFVLPCIGLHPLQVTEDQDGQCTHKSITLADYEGFEDKVMEASGCLAAIGEVGLDFTPRFVKCPEDKDNQKIILIKQVRLAEKLNLPLNVHSRSAGKHAIQLLKENGARHVLLHAFDGRASTALEGVSCGFFFSVTAAIGRDPQMEKMVRTLPLENLVLETDSPAISPTKGTRNEPANIAIACEHIARIKGITQRDVRCLTTENAVKLFPKLKEVLDR